MITVLHLMILQLLRYESAGLNLDELTDKLMKTPERDFSITENTVYNGVIWLLKKKYVDTFNSKTEPPELNVTISWEGKVYISYMAAFFQQDSRKITSSPDDFKNIPKPKGK
jgi:hypothetical protein